MVVTPDNVERYDASIAILARPNRAFERIRATLEGLRTPDGSTAWMRLRVLDAFRAAKRAGAQVFEIEESFGWAGRLAGHGLPVVERLHGPHAFVRDEIETAEQKRSGDLREDAERRSFEKVQAISAPTQRLLDELIDRYRLSPPIVRAIPNPIPLAPRGAVWNLDQANPNQILFVGRFDLCKGADVLVRAFAHALQERPSLNLVMAGPDIGLPQPGLGIVHFSQFVEREVPPDARARIRFLGLQPPERIAELRLQSAFSIVPSRFETFGYTIVEAMAVGMPVLASDTFGPGEIIRDRVDGRLMPIGDVDATASAMLAMASDPPVLAAMGRAAYDRVSEWLSPARIARETLSLYREVLVATEA
jgi:glycosyltransferase involved in cell wall biosynthesis